MEIFLGLSVKECSRRLITEPIVFIKTLLIYWWMKLFRLKHRLHLYDPSDAETTRRGPFLLPIEKEVEVPTQFKDDLVVDSVLLFGVNSLGDQLLARVSREREGHLYWLYLKLSDGRIYQPATSQTIFTASESHSAGGLRIRCLVPMRRWRISYNGILRESREGSKETRTVHVQFSFVCNSTALPLDLIEAIPSPILADVLARKSGFKWPPDPKILSGCLDRFVQPANYVGTIKIGEDDEQEINLWGVRQRTKDCISWRNGTNSGFTEVIGYTEDGQVIYGGEYQLPSLKEKLVLGLHLERCGYFWPVESCSIDFARSQKSIEGVNIEIKSVLSGVKATAHAPTVSFNTIAGVKKGFTAYAHITDLQTQDGDKGNAIILEYKWKNEHDDSIKSTWILPPLDLPSKSTPRFVLPLTDNSCKLPSLTGGKGSSLANLTYLAKSYPTNFEVPTGFVVTTAAYEEFFSHAGVKSMFSSFEKTGWSSDYESLKVSCQQLDENVSKLKLPLTIQKAVAQVIQELFSGNVSGKRFAVRSSASGEDSEEMSAAGQMTTFLGVSGMNNIFESIVKCWASQFSFTAVQYKRQNGQELNSMMAVVVQEMVPADVAGVLFTCDPVSGNPQNLTITANYGIGESVVSASAEPDTIVLFRDERQQVSLKSVQIGKKNIKTVMKDDGNVTEEHLDEEIKTVCCISDDNSLKLARTGLKIEEAYGVPLDIEWAYHNDQLYMLQARPITTIHKETRCEIFHSAESSVRTEHEYSTRTNVGEVLPHASSHLGISLFLHVMSTASTYCYGKRNPYSFPMSPFTNMVIISYNYSLINMTNMVLRFYQKNTESFAAEAGMVAGFGRILDDQTMYDHIDRRNKTYPTTFVPYQIFTLIYDLIFGSRHLLENIERMKKENCDLNQCSSSKEMFTQIWKKVNDTIYSPGSHFTNTVNSSLYNNMLMSTLRAASKDWNADLFSDFSSLLSLCGSVESADIPQSIQKIAQVIKNQNDSEKFKEMSPEDALKWLENTKTPAGKEFKEFINRHGHRGLMELDVYRKPWRVDKIPVIRALQDSVDVSCEEKKAIPVSEVIKNLKTQLSWSQKLLLRILIPLCKKSVMYREKSKSLYVKFMDTHRRGFCTLAEQMVKEGRLPDQELLFFLTSHEILQLIETRNPTLVQKTFRRRAQFAELDNYRFPDICKGLPKPVYIKDRKNYDDLPSDLEVTGTPVSQGTVEGYARVATTLKEAALIQRGEILIAHSTDIYWSPYFPLLGGVVTELGGLISHGAVVAREYGLPCVLGIENATLKFKTGDYVVLDGNKGILKRIPKPEE